MSFFYDLNKKLDGIRATPEVTHKQLNERDMGKHNNATTGFKAVADKAAKEYGSKAAGERVAGAVKAKMAKAGKLEEEQVDEVVRAGVLNPTGGGGTVLNRPSTQGDRDALAKQIKNVRADTMNPAKRGGTSGKTSNTIYTAKQVDHAGDWTATPKARDGKGIASGPTMAEAGVLDTVKNVGKKVAGGINKLVGHGSDEEMIKDLQRKSGAPVTGKKPTFADKIANAKKEVDEMLGDVAAEAIKTALSPKQKKIDMNKNGKLDANDFAMLRKGAKKGHSGEMDEEKSKGTAFDMSAPRQVAPKVGSVERGHKHDIKHTATGRMVTRRVDDQGNSVGADDDSTASGEKRGRGRPKGTKQSIGAKGPSGRSKLMTKEGDLDPADQGEYDQEGEMAKDDIKTVVRHAQALQKILGDNDNLPEWVQSKLAKIEGMMISIDEYMQNQEGDDEMAMGEEKTAKRDNRAEQAGKKVTKDIEYDEKKKDGIHGKKRGAEDAKAEKAGKKVAKDIEYDEKKKKKDEEVDESTTSGSVATSTASGGSKGGVFGKGIYDSMNRELENMIAESMSINMSDSTEGGKSLTVTATDEDAMRLAVMLKSAGLGGQGRELQSDDHAHSEEPCDTCGMQDCGCGDIEEAVDENAPDWPTNTETSPDALQYAGGLNKPKTDVAGDGQTTIPNTAVHTQDEDALRRMMEMAGIRQAELEPWEQTMKEEEEEDFFHNPNVPADKQLSAPPKEVELDEELEEDFLESIQRMREIAGIREAKKSVGEEKTEEGNLFTKGLEDDDVKIGDKIPGTNAIKKKDIDESIFALTNQWKAYKG